MSWKSCVPLVVLIPQYCYSTRCYSETYEKRVNYRQHRVVFCIRFLKSLLVPIFCEARFVQVLESVYRFQCSGRAHENLNLLCWPPCSYLKTRENAPSLEKSKLRFLCFLSRHTPCALEGVLAQIVHGVLDYYHGHRAEASGCCAQYWVDQSAAQVRRTVATTRWLQGWVRKKMNSFFDPPLLACACDCSY